MNTKLKNNDNIKNAFDELFGQLSDKDRLENDANLLMFQFLSIIETKCEQQGLNRKQLAKKVNMSASYISQVFNGDKQLNMMSLAKFQKALGFNFEVHEKKSYDEEVKDYSPIGDGKGVWVYRKFGNADYDTGKKLPMLEECPNEKVA